jgi:hypothetical protein
MKPAGKQLGANKQPSAASRSISKLTPGSVQQPYGGAVSASTASTQSSATITPPIGPVFAPPVSLGPSAVPRPGTATARQLVASATNVSLSIEGKSSQEKSTSEKDKAERDKTNHALLAEMLADNGDSGDDNEKDKREDAALSKMDDKLIQRKLAQRLFSTNRNIKNFGKMIGKMFLNLVSRQEEAIAKVVGDNKIALDSVVLHSASAVDQVVDNNTRALSTALAAQAHNTALSNQKMESMRRVVQQESRVRDRKFLVGDIIGGIAYTICFITGTVVAIQTAPVIGGGYATLAGFATAAGLASGVKTFGSTLGRICYEYGRKKICPKCCLVEEDLENPRVTNAAQNSTGNSPMVVPLSMLTGKGSQYQTKIDYEGSITLGPGNTDFAISSDLKESIDRLVAALTITNGKGNANSPASALVRQIATTTSLPGSVASNDGLSATLPRHNSPLLMSSSIGSAAMAVSQPTGLAAPTVVTPSSPTTTATQQ